MHTTGPGARHASCVYFMQFGRRQPVKIGYTRRLGTRLVIFEAAHHQPLSLIATYPGGPAAERLIHALLAVHRIGLTEWFKPHAEVLGFAREIASAKLSNELRASIEFYREHDLDTLFLGAKQGKKERGG